MFKLPHNCTHLTCEQSNAQNSSSQASTVHAYELPDVQTGFRKGRATKYQMASISWIIEKTRETSVSVLLTMPKPLTVWITINCGKF